MDKTTSADVLVSDVTLIESPASNTIFWPLIAFRAAREGITASFTRYTVLLGEASVISTSIRIEEPVMLAISNSKSIDTAAGDAGEV